MEVDVTYELQPDQERVHVTVEMELTNFLRSYVRSDGVTVIPVYTSVSVQVPAEATNITASRVGGGTLSTFMEDFEEPDPQWKALGVNLTPDLQRGSPQRVILEFDLADQPPRSVGVTRASPAYTLFPIYAMGDPEYATVTVIAPDVYEELEVVGSPMSRSTTDEGAIRYVADDIDEEFFSMLAARNDDLLAERAVSSGDYTFVLRYTPGDEEWADFAQDVVSRGVTLLEDAIGEPWPGGADMEIIESSSPHAFGYAGWFDLAGNSIEVSDQLDPITMLHELAHAWFNHTTMSERWLREGFADLYADIAVHRMSGWTPLEDAGPSDSEESVPLADWDESSVGLREVDEYGYDTAWWAMDQIYDDLGSDAMADVLAAAMDHEIPYAAADGARETTIRGPVDWQRMLDLLEEVGGSDSARQVYTDLVLNEQGLARLESRDEARTAYDALVADAGEWGAPYELRRAMTTWSFPRVSDLIAESERILDQRAGVIAALDHFGVGELPLLQDEYIGSDRLDDVIELGEQYLAATDVIDAAQDRPTGFLGALTWVGEKIVLTDLVVADAADHVVDGELDEARALWQAIIERVEEAPKFGGIVLGEILLSLLMVPFIIRARRRRRSVKRATVAAAGVEPAMSGDDASREPEDAVAHSGNGVEPADVTPDGQLVAAATADDDPTRAVDR